MRLSFSWRCARTLAGSLLLIVLLAAAGCKTGAQVVRSTAGFSAGTGFIRHEVVVDGQAHAVWVFIPQDYQPSKRYPAILFLHGLFEAGSGYDRAVSAGLGPVIAKDPQHWPFITIFPQSDGTWQGEAREHIAISALDFAQAHYAIDPDRVILAGLSYGALGTWQIGAKHSDRFAALVPVSGHRATDAVERVIMLPVWAFAFSGDPIVKPQSSEEMCREIDQRGGRAKLTEFLGVGHDCWDKAVEGSNVVDWMLQQRRNTHIDYPQRETGAVAHIE
jgi:predicted peptidase